MTKNALRDIAICAIVPYLVVAAFSSKPYHIDDPAYLWTARQILKSPLDFYGFKVNWGSTDVMMYDANKNPPGISFYIALGARLFGWGERAQHLWMGLFAALLGVSTYLLARRLCTAPLLAALVVLSMPVVIVSSTTVMTDVPMLALFTLSVYLWIIGIDRKSHLLLASAGAAAAAAFLVKYFAFALVPLLLAYGLLRFRRPGAWCLHLLIPTGVAAVYMAWAYRLYGLNPLADAASYATGASKDQFSYVHAKPLIGVVFTGGCLMTAALYATLIFRWRIAAVALAGGLVASFVFYRNDGYFFYAAASSTADRARFTAHYSLFLVAGALIFGLAARDLFQARNADASLLALWLGGTFIFSTFLNWSVTARTILPMSVPISIVVARALRDRKPAWAWWRYAPLAAGVLLSLAVAYGDFAAASSTKQAALKVIDQSKQHNGRYWFMGHWGYQYYLEETGMRFFTDQAALEASPGDRVAVARWLTLAPMHFDPATSRAVPEAQITVPNSAFVSTHHPVTRSGFYSCVLGPLPYTFGPSPDAAVDVMELGPARQ